MEIWKDIVGYEGRYQVSNNGKIKTFCRIAPIKYPKLLKPNTTRDGYLTVCLISNTGKRKTWSVHRLVAMVFISNAEQKPEVNHKDGNKKNNLAENLEWVTHPEQMAHAARLQLFSDRNGERNSNAKLSSNDVLELIRLYDFDVYTPKDLAEKYNIAKPTVIGILSGRLWNHLTNRKDNNPFKGKRKRTRKILTFI